VADVAPKAVIVKYTIIIEREKPLSGRATLSPIAFSDGDL
jgi:hypothetical protein